MNIEETMITAINGLKMIELTFNSKEKGKITRVCIPFDIGPSKKYKDGLNRFHFYDLNSPEGKHNLSILPHQIFKIEILDEIFNPGDYITWSPINWIISRNWGKYS